MEEKRGSKNYRIGLDIGITSVGWSAVEMDEKDEPRHIMDLGVRIFEAAEIPKTGESLAKPRRDARTTRRRLRRRHHRLERIRILLKDSGMIDDIEAFDERYHTGGLPDVYRLRCIALDQKIDDDEFAQILIHIAKHRGFKSTRKAETLEKEGGAVLTATKENKKIMEENHYRSVGEMICKDDAFREYAPWSAEGYVLSPRNKQENYKHTILRDLLEEEVKLIFEKQREFGNEKATKELEEKYLEIMLGQRSFDKGPGNQANGQASPYAGDLIEKMLGNCTLEPDEKRASKYTYTSERFVLLQKVNNLRLLNKDGETQRLTDSQRAQVITLAYAQKDIKFSTIRKKLNLSNDYTFRELNYGAGEKEEQIKKVESGTKFVSLEYFHQAKKIFNDLNYETITSEQIDLLDRIGRTLTLYKSDEEREKRFQELGIDDSEIEKLLILNPSKFQHLSLKAMKKILPYLEQGFVYSDACENAGYDFKAENKAEKAEYLKGDIVSAVLEEIPNPVVKRAVSQTVKVLNAIIRKYGSPQAVHIELAREMSKNFTERQQIDKQNKKNQDNNEAVKRRIRDEFHVTHPTGQDILKFRLWQDQDGICMYSGETIPIESLFLKDEVEIDHIIPYSISFDDSYKNKVLVKSQYNREKGNRLPYEYFGSQENRWHKYELLVNQYVKDYRKRQILLKKSFTKEDREAFKERNLTDTKYITTVVNNLIRNHLKMADYNASDKKKHVYPVNGAITAYMRKRWGLMQKDRSTDRHHAMDATVIACCTDGMIQKISHNVKGRELAFAYGFKYVDEETGEILDRSNFTREQWDEAFGVQIPEPWHYFSRDLEMRMADDPHYFDSDFRRMGYTVEEIKDIRPIFVSRMPRHKITGAAHADTIRSPRHFEKDGIVLSKVDLATLKLDKDGEIAGYYDPDSDRLLYNAIKKQLQLHGGSGTVAFPKGTAFHKPKADGTPGPLVKKVKVSKKQSLGVLLNDGAGIAENGSMVRIDVFCENGKYYFVPIYTSDTKKKVLPNRAAMNGKIYNDWKEMKGEDFIFSLYSRDLIKFKHKTGIKTCNVNGVDIIINEQLVYYFSADISTASISGSAPDSSYKFRSIGIQSLEYLKKYQVDILGNVTEVKHEKRMTFK